MRETASRSGSRGGKEIRVDVQLDRVADRNGRIKREWLLDDPVLSDLLILRQASGTNYPVSHDQASRLETLWARTGEDWTEAESIAGLWAYAHTKGSAVSRRANSLIADIAVRIGRAVTGVYNKVMNFRHLDPTDNREGLSGVGDTDRAVWARFFNDTKRKLDVAALDATFSKLWGTRKTSPPFIAKAKPVHETPSRSGAGYEDDPRIRRAVEEQAMTCAMEYYKAEGFEVEDTHASHPFDLRCRREKLEIRVEVKGTRGDGSSVTVTKGEVATTHSDEWRSDLFLLFGIGVRQEGDRMLAHGGTRMLFEDWRPDGAHLTALTFRYTVTKSLGRRLD